MDGLPFDEVIGRISLLADDLVSHPDPTVAGQVTELLDWVDAFHRDGLGRLVEMIRQWRGEIFLDAVAADPIAGEFLHAYGLGAGGDDAEARRGVQEALAEARPYLHSHGGDVEVIDIVDGVVRLRMSGACDGCTGSQATIVSVIESALRAGWADFRAVEVADMTAPAHPPPPSASSAGIDAFGPAPGSATPSVVTGLQIGRKR